jgi:hypothetical protein
MVAPVVMLTEGVHNGSNGPLYYPAIELAKTPAVWNHKPVVVYHPERNGQGVTACDPDVLERRSVGMMLNTRWDAKAKKLRSEVWMEEARIDDVEPRIREHLDQNKLMEVSTGLYTDNELTEGKFGDKSYVAIARNYRPDHLALLPDLVGSCSVADGAGLLQVNKQALLWRGMPTNELSHSNISAALQTAIVGRSGRNDYICYITDIYDSFFIYAEAGELYKQGYHSSDSSVTLVGDPSEVKRVTEYRTLDGEFVGNKTEVTDMDKKAVVDGLIANKVWEEEHRAFLMGLAEDQLKRLVLPAPVANANPAPVPAAVVTPPAPASAPSAVPPVAAPAVAPVINTPSPVSVPASPVVLTAEQYVANAPPGIRDLLNSGLRAQKAQRDTHIATIKANPGNVFADEFLQNASGEVLEGLAALAQHGQQQQPSRVLNYSGAAAPGGVKQHKEEPLKLPTMNFESAKA